jgi:hypothetical protein
VVDAQEFEAAGGARRDATKHAVPTERKVLTGVTG